MTYKFDDLPNPEPSSLVGFSQNKLIRDAEHRTDQTLQDALADQETSFFLFVGNKVLVKKSENSQVLFTKSEAEAYSPKYSDAILLGQSETGPQIALPIELDEETLSEPWALYDLRSLLYSSSISERDAGAVAQAGSLLHWNMMNQFCGKCGAVTASKIGGYRRDCEACDTKMFPRTDPVVIMLTIKDDKCLMGRSPHFPEGWYSTLAGFVEPGETMEDAMRRETFEESGIHIGRVGYFASQPWPFPHSLMLGLYGEALSDEINMDATELEDCRWFTRDDVKLMLKEAHPEGFLCPPNRAIASTLIMHWANQT